MPALTLEQEILTLADSFARALLEDVYYNRPIFRNMSPTYEKIIYMKDKLLEFNTKVDQLKTSICPHKLCDVCELAPTFNIVTMCDKCITNLNLDYIRKNPSAKRS